MKKRVEQDLSRLRDGELAPGRSEAVRRALADSEELTGLDAAFQEIGDRVRDLPVPAGPPPEVAWQNVQRAIRLGQPDASAADRILGSPLRWVAGTLTVGVIAVALGMMLNQDAAVAAIPPAEVEWVDTEVPGATTMVYQDDETGLTVIWVMEEDRQENGNKDS